MRAAHEAHRILHLVKQWGDQARKFCDFASTLRAEAKETKADPVQLSQECESNLGLSAYHTCSGLTNGVDGLPSFWAYACSARLRKFSSFTPAVDPPLQLRLPNEVLKCKKKMKELVLQNMTVSLTVRLIRAFLSVMEED